MGLIFMIINILTEEDEFEASNIRVNTQENDRNSQVGPLLQVKFFGGPCQGEVQYILLRSFSLKFWSSTVQPSGRPLRVGRQEDCDVYIDDSLLSKYQCSIEYTQSNGKRMK